MPIEGLSAWDEQKIWDGVRNEAESEARARRSDVAELWQAFYDLQGRIDELEAEIGELRKAGDTDGNRDD